jgi:hypothetical protein
MPRPVVIAAVLASALAAACGGASAPPKPAPATPYSAHGLTVSLPSGWRVAPRSLTPHLIDPRERLSVGTFPLRFRETECAQFPGSALADLGARDALLTLQERGNHTTVRVPPRPARFGGDAGTVHLSEAHACTPGGGHFADRWLEFSDGGRNFYALIAFGPQATKATRAQTWRILNGLRVDPSVRPTWPNAG